MPRPEHEIRTRGIRIDFRSSQSCVPGGNRSDEVRGFSSLIAARDVLNSLKTSLLTQIVIHICLHLALGHDNLTVPNQHASTVSPTTARDGHLNTRVSRSLSEMAAAGKQMALAFRESPKDQGGHDKASYTLLHAEKNQNIRQARPPQLQRRTKPEKYAI
jgi:hypothetical protein